MTTMDTKLAILTRLDAICREQDLNDLGEIQWEDGQVLRSCVIRTERGDPNGWLTFLEHLQKNPEAGRGFRYLFEEFDWAESSPDEDRLLLTLPLTESPPLSESESLQLLNVLDPPPEPDEQEPDAAKSTLGTIMYIEEKPDLAGHARIGRVRFSGTRKTLYYAGRKLRSLKGGYKANYLNIESGLKYWISNCRKDGNDTLYPGVVEIDEDAREEYWTTIRQCPEKIHLTQFRSEGKYSKRRPC